MEVQLKELHETNGYSIVAVRDKDANAIAIAFPPNILLAEPIPSITIMYEICDGSIQKYNAGDMLSPPTKLKVPNYTARCLIITDIVCCCLKSNLSSLLIINYDKDGMKIDDDFDTFDLLDCPNSTEEASKEKALKGVLRAMMNGQTDCPAIVKAEGIEEGYQLLLEVFRMGGF